MATETAAVKAKIEARAYPIADPKNKTVAFASVTIDDKIAINGIRVIDGQKGLFITMPQAKDGNGEYRDICFPVTAELRKQLQDTVLDAYAVAQKEKAAEKTADQGKGKASAKGKGAKKPESER